MNLNNLYNFKNTVKHFININEFIVPNNLKDLNLKYFSWVEPFNFRIRKQDDKCRTLKIPNILNFYRAYEQFKEYPYFEDIQKMDYEHKRLSANIKTGDFAEGEYDRQLELDFENLCIYDNLIKMDIKEYYGRIYTHDLGIDFNDEKFIYNMNNGATNGLIMGNYLSLYLAEKKLANISSELENELKEQKIDCEFSYFSDDFYFFCNKYDNEKIIKIFDKILEKYELERNDSKKEIWTYESFNNYNLVERYWKKVIAYCNIRFDSERDNNKLYFINQLVYRMSNLKDEKLKKVFINNFFKTKYFRELDLNKYKFRNYDYHQLCFLLKFSPESMLYSIDKFNSMKDFNKEKIKRFLQIKYKESLYQLFNDEQLYYYYSIKILGFKDILIDLKNFVLKSENQILISYYLKDNIFEKEDIKLLKENFDKKYWFQNYHLILYSEDLKNNLEDSIKDYLIPKNAKSDNQKNIYYEFYSKNINANNTIIRDISNVNEEIDCYLNLKIEENEKNWNCNEEEFY